MVVNTILFYKIILLQATGTSLMKVYLPTSNLNSLSEVSRGYPTS